MFFFFVVALTLEETLQFMNRPQKPFPAGRMTLDAVK